MSRDLPHIIPSPQLRAEETFAVYQAAHEFYHEVRVRSDFKLYCEWHYTTAESHRQELKRMRGEPNIFRWFRRR